MKKIISLILSGIICISLCACGEEGFDPKENFDKLGDYVTGEYETSNFYMQISKTKADHHSVTEVSKLGDDKAMLTFEAATGELTFFRNGKLTNVTADSILEPEEKNKNWEKLAVSKTSETYVSALKQLCAEKFDGKQDRAYIEISSEDSKDEKYPYKVTAKYNLDHINAKGLFNSGGNFGSLSIKYLTNENGTEFSDIELHVQYDYDSEIYVIMLRYGDPALPDDKGGEGQRPEDIEKIFNGYYDSMKKSFNDYLESLQESVG